MSNDPAASNHERDEAAGRRQFLKKAGLFAAATPPTITLLLNSGSLSPAWASGHGSSSHGNNGYGNGGHDGVPGRSGKSDSNR